MNNIEKKFQAFCILNDLDPKTDEASEKFEASMKSDPAPVPAPAKRQKKGLNRAIVGGGIAALLIAGLIIFLGINAFNNRTEPLSPPSITQASHEKELAEAEKVATENAKIEAENKAKEDAQKIADQNLEEVNRLKAEKKELKDTFEQALREDAEKDKKAKEAADKAITEAEKVAAEKTAATEALAAEALENETTRKEVHERAYDQMGIITSTKNFNAKGGFDLSDEEMLKKAFAGWLEQDGYYFPLIKNPSGNPSPVKGADEPYPLAPRGTKWEERKVTLENPRGSGSYTTTGWATKTRPNIRK